MIQAVLVHDQDFMSWPVLNQAQQLEVLGFPDSILWRKTLIVYGHFYLRYVVLLTAYIAI